MSAANVSLGLAFLAGLASFLSPCVFSLVPAYIGYLGGRAAGGVKGVQVLVVLFTTRPVGEELLIELDDVRVLVRLAERQTMARTLPTGGQPEDS